MSIEPSIAPGLNLDRHVGQVILVGDDIRICVKHVDIHTGKVVLNIVAPRHISIDRPEVRAKREASVNKVLKTVKHPSTLSLGKGQPLG